MNDEVTLRRFGTPLPELEEDTIPSKKPIRPEDQIVTDENGKRRFHGAFTGGFSAGYWNTVGSQEGWTPSSFKSSRAEKALQRATQLPEDFMDDEDRGEFGIAPQRLQARPEYANENLIENRKRKVMPPSAGAIPGEPVLEQLLKLRGEKIGVYILKSMGWRPGQGIGPRQTRKEKNQTSVRNRREMYVMQQYGYEPGKGPSTSSDEVGNKEFTSSDEEYNDEIKFAPDDYEPFLCHSKMDRFGLGYKEHLSRDPVLSQSFNRNSSEAKSHINLFEVLDKNNKKVTIAGKAFGVGALEEEDEDIYARDDMTKYDFSLDNNKPKAKKKETPVQDRLIIEGFESSKNSTQFSKHYNVDIPENFKPRNWTERRSRFEPLDPKRALDLENNFKQIEFEKHELNPNKRAKLLGEVAEDDNRPSTSAEARLAQQESELRIHGGGCMNSKRFERDESEQADENTCTIKYPQQGKPYIQLSEPEINTSRSMINNAQIFKPFIYDAAKQKRYEEFLRADVSSEEEISSLLNNIQPLNLCKWDREREMREFRQASRIFQPLKGLMSERFISETAALAGKRELKSTDRTQPHIIKRTRSTWKPSSFLCKRYNICEPCCVINEEQRIKKPTKISVFEYMEDSLNKRNDFKIPRMLPRQQESTESLCSTISPSVGSVISTSSSSTSATSVVVVEKIPNKHSQARVQVGRCVSKTDLERLVDGAKDKPAWENVELYKKIFVDSSDEESEDKCQVTIITDNESDILANQKVQAKFLSEEVSKNAKTANVLRNNSPPRGIFASLLSDNALTTSDDKKPEAQSSSYSFISFSKSAEKESLSSELNSVCVIAAPHRTEEQICEEPSNCIIVDMPSTKLIYTAKRKRVENVEMNKEKEDKNTQVYGPQIPEHIAKLNKVDSSTSSTEIKFDRLSKRSDNDIIELFVKSNKNKSKNKNEEEWIEKEIKASKSSDRNSSKNSSGSHTYCLSSSSDDISQKISSTKKLKKKSSREISLKKTKKKDKERNKYKNKEDNDKKPKKKTKKKRKNI